MQGNDNLAEGDASNGMARIQSPSQAMVTRPPNCRIKTGTSGKPVELVANFVGVAQYDVVIQRANVEFDPLLNSKALRHSILKQQHLQNEIGDAFIFDGTTLYLTGDTVVEGTLVGQHPTNSEEVNVHIRPFSPLSRDDPQTIKCYNVVLRRCIEMIGLKRLGRNYFDEEQKVSVQAYDMEIWPGFEAAVRQNENRLMLCIENHFKIIRTQSVWDIITHEYRRMERDHKRLEARMEEILVGQLVFTRYNCKLFRVSSIGYDMSPATMFTPSDGSETSIKDYLERTYNLRVTQLSQPVIVSKIEAKQPDGVTRYAYLLPEFCFLTGVTESMKKDHRHMKELAQHMRLDPEKRCRKIDDLLERIHNNGRCRALLQKWGITLEEKLVTLQSRELEPEKLTGYATAWYTGERAEWSRIMRNSVAFRPVDLHNWVVITPNTYMAKNLAIQFIEEVKHLGESMRIDINYPMLQLCGDTTPNSYRNALLEAMQRAADQPIRMAVIMLHDDNKTRYGLLKLWLCTETDIPSQCVQLSTLRGHPRDGGRSKNFTAIIVKIVLQMICKMGGALWKVNIPVKRAMFVGYDVYRDSTLREKTIGACVSTFDEDYTKFYSQARPHDNRADLGTNLRCFIKKALYEYYINNNRTLPQKIFLYRDGVDDGQIPFVKEQEVLIVQQACIEMTMDFGLDPELCPIRLAFVIVTKKVNMRVFKRDPDTFLRNPNPGTVVDSVVTRPERFDFYLVPQHVNQGTVTPVCYNVIYDDTGLLPDQHHRLAFKLCHLYYNWQGTVRVPAPCQYAHKLAFMVAQSIQTNVEENMNVTKELRNKLFFL